MPASSTPLIGSFLLRRYELMREIGRGGCAVVYEARDHRLQRVVAIKLPIDAASDTARVSRFARESRVLASIHHQNVCAVLDSGVMEDETPFLVLERLYGESLRRMVTRSRLGIREALSIGVQLLSALEAVHGAGVVHRDVKPDNIVLVARGGCDPVVKLLDFGLCRRAAKRREREEETMTCEGAIVGTPEYMAPEQVLGSAALDVRVDLYAVGVVLYEALTGDRAFFSKNLREILSGVMTKKIPSLRQVRPEVPATLERVVARAMARNPAQRYQTATSLQRDLIAIKAEIAANPVAAPVRAPAPSASWEAPTTRFERHRRPQRPPPIVRAPETLTTIAS